MEAKLPEQKKRVSCEDKNGRSQRRKMLGNQIIEEREISTKLKCFLFHFMLYVNQRQLGFTLVTNP
jgi:hypothetical protein